MIRFSDVSGAEEAMSRPRDDRQRELFRPSLGQIIDMAHPLVRQAARSNGVSSIAARARSTSTATAILRCQAG